MSGLDRFPSLTGRRPARLLAAMAALGPAGATWLALAGALLDGERLDPVVRELVILRVAWLRAGAYVWGGHALIAADAGLDFGAGHPWTARQRLAVAVADGLAGGGLDDRTRRAALDAWGPDGLLELVMVAGQYLMLCQATSILGFPAEPGCPDLPAAWPGPEPDDV